jgi:hypothetical protein
MSLVLVWGPKYDCKSLQTAWAMCEILWLIGETRLRHDVRSGHIRLVIGIGIAQPNRLSK